jgi:hypothetical protein
LYDGGITEIKWPTTTTTTATFLILLLILFSSPLPFQCHDLCSVNGCVDTDWVQWLTVDINGIFLMVRFHQIPK